MWDLEPERYESVLGIENTDAGLADRRRLVAGKPITADSKAVLIDSDFASNESSENGRHGQGPRGTFRWPASSTLREAAQWSR